MGRLAPVFTALFCPLGQHSDAVINGINGVLAAKCILAIEIKHPENAFKYTLVTVVVLN